MLERVMFGTIARTIPTRGRGSSCVFGYRPDPAFGSVAEIDGARF